MKKHDPWLPFPLGRTAAAIRLFCLPPAGGGAALFRSWRDLLSYGIEVCPVQLPGREARVNERPFERMAPLVSALVSALSPHLDTRFAIFGHSMGGLVAFEIAKQLRRTRGPRPLHLFVSAARAPHLRDTDAHHLLSDDALLAELHKMRGFSREVLQCRELMEVLLPTIRADAAITETYTLEPEEPLDCALTVLAGADDDQVQCDEVAAWRPYTRGPYSGQIFPGGHDFLTTASGAVQRCIVQALTAEHSSQQVR